MSYNSSFDRGSWRRPVHGAGVQAIDVDLGLRRYMLQVYNFMAAGLGVTGLVAYAAVATGVYQQIAGTPLIWLIMLAPLGAVLFLSFRIEQMSAGTAQATFWTYAALMGLSLASIFLLFTGTSIARVFLHRCRNVRRDEPLRLHDAARPVGSARAYSRALSATDRRAASTVAGVLIQLARSWRVARRARRLGPNTISSIPRKGELLPPVRAAK